LKKPKRNLLRRQIQIAHEHETIRTAFWNNYISLQISCILASVEALIILKENINSDKFTVMCYSIILRIEQLRSMAETMSPVEYLLYTIILNDEGNTFYHELLQVLASIGGSDLE
jgi:hypothetical protein